MRIFEHSRHILEVRCTHLLDSVWSLELSLVLNLTAVTARQRTNLFECGWFWLPYLALTQLPNRWFSLITSIVVYIRTRARECHTMSRVIVPLLGVSTKILPDALRRVHNLLRIWIVHCTVFFGLLLVITIAILRLHCFHAIVRLLQCELCPQLFVLLGWLEGKISCWSIEGIHLILLGYAACNWFSWFFYGACIYGFSVFVWVEILSCLFTAPDA